MNNTKLSAILFALDRFDSSGDEEFLADEKLGALIGVYSNAPFGDDLYVYEKGVYWNVNGINYCVFFCDIDSVALENEDASLIKLKLKSTRVLDFPVRGKSARSNDVMQFISLLDEIIADNYG